MGEWELDPGAQRLPLISSPTSGICTSQIYDEDSVDRRPKTNKKTKGGAAPLATGSFPYHQEEEMIESRSTATFTYALKTAPPRDDESFGVEQFGRLMLVDAGKLAQAVEAMEEACR